MKKLIVLSVVFALVASAAFAVDLGGTVFAKVTPLQGNSDSDEITASGGFGRVRLEGYGEVAEGTFGGWMRYDSGSFSGAYAFWKPIDQLKILIGGNPDGMYGKEGVTGWMFNENPYDIGAAFGGNNVWGWNGGANDNSYGQQIKTRNVFYGGFDGNGLQLNITPFDVLTVNLVLPFWGGGTEIVDAILKVKAQVDLNFDFGNIAVTYDGNGKDQGGKVYAYFGAPIGPLGLDVGVSYGFDENGDYSIGAGVGLKFATDVFGIRFRGVTTIDVDEFKLLTELNPYFTFSDKFAVFINLGLCMTLDNWSSDSVLDFSVNPYLRIGEEWGAQFLVGFQLWSTGGIDGGKISWGVPVCIGLSF